MRGVQDTVASSSVGAAKQAPVPSLAVLCTVQTSRVGDGASRPSKKRLVSAWQRLKESVTDLRA